jgi:hypothetical protein
LDYQKNCEIGDSVSLRPDLQFRDVVVGSSSPTSDREMTNVAHCDGRPASMRSEWDYDEGV